MADDALVKRIVDAIKSASAKKNLANLIAATKTANSTDISNSISRIIKNKVTISGPVATAIVKQLPQKNLVPVITQIIKGAVGTEAAKAVISTAPKNAISNSIISIIKNRVAIPKNIKNELQQKNLLPNVNMNFIPVNLGSNGKPAYSGPKPGYIFTTRNGKTGYFRNAYVEKPSGPLGPFQPPTIRNYSKMKISELLAAMRMYPTNKSKIIEQLRLRFAEELYKLRRMNGALRTRRIGDLLRILPRNFTNRRNATSIIVEDVRNTQTINELNNLQRNLGKVPNENIRSAFAEQRKRVGRSGGGGNWGRTGGNLGRTGTSNGNWRRALISKTSTPSGAPPNAGNWRKALAGAAIPEEQKRAINGAGGIPNAMRQIERVPEGPPEIARTAEALKLTNGNVTQAMEVHNVRAPSVNVVRQLGGPTNTVRVLEGLNTLSTPKQRGMMRRKTKGLRVAELNKVINAVRKKKLISLVAHNVTKTNNIHENENRLKKYYKKVLKANILRTPFAKIAKSAAKKRVM